MKNKKTLILMAILFVSMLLMPLNNILINNNDGNIVKEVIDDDSLIDEKIDSFDFSPKLSDITYHDYKLNVSGWGNKTYRYRIGIELEEKDSVDRYQPIDIYLTFRENEHFENSTRLVMFNQTGNDEWSDPLPIQVWNKTKYDANYLQSCTITFIANVSADSNQTYFLYFNENMDNIEQPSYNTGFISDLSSGTANIQVNGPSGAAYNVSFEEGLAITQLEKDTLNFHTNTSLRPEKLPNELKFLGHMDENSGTTTTDSKGFNIGTLTGNADWTTGKINSGIVFDGNGDYVTFGNILNDPFGTGCSYWTVSAWIYPTALQATQSNHGTRNCFIAKASDPNNDNLELGITDDGKLHVYIDAGLGSSQDTYDDYGVSSSIPLDTWTFIAVRYDNGDVDVLIDDIWYRTSDGGTEPWATAGDMDNANGSPFTIGATEHINTYFTGKIDEVVVYSNALSDSEIENSKTSSYYSTIYSISELEHGPVFSQYQVDWTQTYDMHVQDIFTFYYDYNLLNIYRSLYFDAEYDSSKSTMTALNAYYNLSGLSNHDLMKYFYDGTEATNIITSDGFTAENYTIIHDPTSPVNNSMGIFIADFEAPHVLASISELKGLVDYDSQFVQFSPGSTNDFDNNIGGSVYKLYINFWEYIEDLTGGLTESDIEILFNNTLITLRNAVDIHLFAQDTFFYNLKVYVEDKDGVPVNEAKVTLYNASDYQQICDAQLTDVTGYTSFERLENGTYYVNASYEKYGRPELTITSPIMVILNETYVDAYGVNTTYFYNVSLTSLYLTFQRVDNGEFKEYVGNANVSFYINDGTGEDVYIGYEYTDLASGTAEFHWKNFTSASEGNVTFQLEWHGDLVNINTTGNLALGEAQKITLPFFNKTIKDEVNVTTDEFITYLSESTPPSIFLGDSIDFQVSYTYTIGGGSPLSIDSATVYYYVKEGSTNISSTILSFDPQGSGIYTEQINTKTPEDTSIIFMAGVTYTLFVSATKPGFLPATASISFSLLDINSTLTPNVTKIELYWNEIISLTVDYQDVFADPDEPILGADVEYSVIQNSQIYGNLTSLGAGQYKFELNSTNFVFHGRYDLQITANKQNYEQKSISISLKINPINTLINNKISIVQPESIKVGTSKIFYFSYTTVTTPALGISNCSTAFYEWQRLDNDGNVIEANQSDLFEIGNGSYKLDFNTEIKPIGSYTLVVSIGQTNYIERTAVISLEIVPRDINLTLPSDVFTNNIIEIISVNYLNFTLLLTDPLNNDAPLDNATVWISFQGNNYNFTPSGNGTYSINIAEIAEIQTMLLIETITSRIYVTKTNYTFTSEGELITINITPVSMLGLPILVWILIGSVAAIFIGGYGIAKYIKYKRIPEFTKKLNKVKKAIKSNKTISESLATETKMEYMINKLSNTWNKLGLSLEDTIGIKGKKLEKIEKESIEVDEEPPKPELEYPEVEEEPPKPEVEYPAVEYSQQKHHKTNKV